MKISLQRPYKSIRQLDPVDIPKMSIITGVNGSGKSHFLEAIIEGSILVDGRPISQEGGADYMGSSQYRPSGSAFDSYPLISDWRANQHEIIKYISKYRDAALLELSTELPLVERGDLELLIENPEVHSRFAMESNDNWRPTARQILNTSVAQLFRTINDSNKEIAIRNIASIFGCSVLGIVPHHLNFPVWGQNERANQISTIFVIYRDNLIRNKLLRIDGEAGAMQDDAFEERFGRAPWLVVDDALEAMGLPFTICRPDLRDYVPYLPMLKSKITGTSVAFKELSSGEVVILNLALASYHTVDRRISVDGTRMLLLDEVDAPLHPAMSRRYVDTIYGQVVRRQGLAVVAVTHSLATVAVAPEESVFVLRPHPHRLEKVSKGEALAILGEGVTTLAVNFTGRRQVFCESEYDAACFAAVYQHVRPQLASARSLDFVAAAVRSDSGDFAGGRAVVRKIVKQMEASGNNSVFGIIDWDGENRRDGRVFVLGEGRRNGLENILLDPLLICGLIVLRFDELRQDIGLSAVHSIHSIKSMPPDDLQVVADRIQDAVLGEGCRDRCEVVSYVGGLTLSISSSYLRSDDHELADKVLRAFGFRSIVNNRTGAAAHGVLMTEIARSVCREFGEFVPVELADAFRHFLQVDDLAPPLDTPPPSRS